MFNLELLHKLFAFYLHYKFVKRFQEIKKLKTLKLLGDLDHLQKKFLHSELMDNFFKTMSKT